MMITRKKIGAIALIACIIVLGAWQMVFLRPGEMSEVQALRLKILRLEERNTAIQINSKLLEAQAKEFQSYNQSIQKAMQIASEEVVAAQKAKRAAEEELHEHKKEYERQEYQINEARLRKERQKAEREKKAKETPQQNTPAAPVEAQEPVVPEELEEPKDPLAAGTGTEEETVEKPSDAATQPVAPTQAAIENQVVPQNPTPADIEVSRFEEKIDELTKKLQSANERLEDLKSPGNVLTGFESMVSILDSHNFNGQILNADKFTLDPDFIPIVVRVFNKDKYFGYALEKYREVEGINKTLLIISHDGVFPEMMAVVRAIDFCQVKQIIHPYSGHIMKNRFPGPDAEVDKANIDQYKNPRPWNFAALKHHFWWHLNYVWDVVLPKHSGDMIFMEEDHVPMYDMLITAKALAKIRKEKCPTCFNSKIHQHNHHGTDVHSAFVSTDLGNVGITFDRDSWLQLKAAGETFCTFQDYNWDWTMTHLVTIKKIKPHSLTATVPRAEHMGKCGTHAKAAQDEKSGACLINENDKNHIAEVNKMLRESNGHDWSNPTLVLDPAGNPANHQSGWGGWTKPDHEHCKAQIKENSAWR